MTENSDAVVLIVSEETGIISVAFNGQITRNHTVQSAFDEIKDKLVNDNDQESDVWFRKILKRIKPDNDTAQDISKEEENNEN